MSFRGKSVFRISNFVQNVIRSCQSQAGLENHLAGVIESPPKHCYSLLFFDKSVQSLLKKITNVDYNIVFKERSLGVALKPPSYKFLTTEQLQKEMDNTEEKANYYLQIPPMVNAAEDKAEILNDDTSLDGYDTHHSKHVFVDISFDETNEKRAIVVREANGVLRTALRNERFRMNQIYFPLPGREVETPKMFEIEHLMDVIKRKEYEFILDRACAQFEPDDKMYHNVITLTYEAVNYNNDFSLLLSTRHFGSLAFYLITHKKIDNMLNYKIQSDRLEDCFALVQLYHIIHPDCESAKVSKGKSEMEILKDFIELDSKNKDLLNRSLDSYLRREEIRKKTENRTEALGA